MGKPQATMPETMSAIRAECLSSWKGQVGEDRAASVRELLNRVLPEYSAALGMSEFDVLTAIETLRNYAAANYYQEANFPKLGDVVLFDTVEDFYAKYPLGKYVCPSCSGRSGNAFECDAGTIRDGKACNWKSYGLFGTMGKGLRVILKDTFLASPRVNEIFLPVELAAIDPCDSAPAPAATEAAA